MAKLHKRIQYFERINFYCPMEESKKWLKHFHNQGYKIGRSGPKIVSWPKVDSKRFHIIAEKEIKPHNNGMHRDLA